MAATALSAFFLTNAALPVLAADAQQQQQQQQGSGGRVLRGKVTRVIDGNTVVVKDAYGESHRVTVYGLIVPEGDKPGAGKATERLRGRTLGKSANCGVISQQQSNGYSKTVAKCNFGK